MEHGNGDEKLAKLKSLLENLVWRSEQLTKNLLKPFSQNSVPVTIYEDELDPLRRTLARIRATLEDSHKYVLSGESPKLWLRELRDMENRAEDIIEELEFQAVWKDKLREYSSQLREKRIGSKRKRDERQLGIFFSSSSKNNLACKIKKLRELQRQIAFDREALSLRKVDPKSLRLCSARPPTSSFINGGFHGRENDVDEVIRLLISNDDHAHGVSVIAIDGMGGVGKTALAQQVFSDEAVKSHFDEQIWICVSEGLDLLKVMIAIREAFGMETCSSELDRVQQDVMSQLRGKRLLLVIDDLWNHEHWEKHWSRILDCLKVASKGSKIIVTTRNSKMPELTGSAPHCHLRSLSEDECWLIFKQHAFHGEFSSINPNLIQIAREINQKCKGLPLAAKVLGCRLKGELSEEKWRTVSEELWGHEECENEILPDLRLSYDDLPIHLQRCFLYCSLFPKGYLFNKDQLCRLWMAQGFSKLDGNIKHKETIGEYFDELAARSFFQHAQSPGSCEKRYVMHDVFDELAQSIAEIDCKRAEDGVLCDISQKTQHSSLILDDCHIEKGIRVEVDYELDLRSLLFIRRNKGIEKVFHFVAPSFKHLQCLRALDLSYTDVDELPTLIGTLIHLRYLGLRRTRIKTLPESMCGLFKLQTLDLKQCRDLRELPKVVKFLSDQQHLQLLTDLQTLSVVLECDQPNHSNEVVEKDMPNPRHSSENFKLKGVADGHSKEVGVFAEVESVGCKTV